MPRESSFWRYAGLISREKPVIFHAVSGVYCIGAYLFLIKNVSRTVVREAIIMLEVEGYVEVRKGSGIHVVSNQPRHQQAADNNMEFANYGPFELLQARHTWPGFC